MDGHTDLFITPGYRFRAVDLLVTNFHVPGSTLIVLVAGSWVRSGAPPTRRRCGVATAFSHSATP